MTQIIRTTKCFRCRLPKVVGMEIARADMHAVCYDCLTGKRPQGSAHTGTPDAAVRSDCITPEPVRFNSRIAPRRDRNKPQ